MTENSKIKEKLGKEANRPDGDGYGEPKDWVCISVSDTGLGIRRDDLEMIFRPFEQVYGARNLKIHGTGLGLSLTRRLIELHGGRIWVESDGEGKGSTFIFILPGLQSYQDE